MKMVYGDLTIQQIAYGENANAIQILFDVSTGLIIYDFKCKGKIVLTINTSIQHSKMGGVIDNLHNNIGELTYPVGCDMDGDFFIISSGCTVE